MKALFIGFVAAAAFSVRSLPQEEGPLEPSVQNEVDHALDLAEAWLARQPVSTNAPPTGDLFRTNGLTRTRTALRLISLQRGEGWWLTSTNTAPTRLARDILKGL